MRKEVSTTPHPRVGAIVECRFLDHCEGGDAVPCVVWGRLIARTRTAYTIVSWEADGEPRNEKKWAIVRRAVSAILTLTPPCPTTNPSPSPTTKSPTDRRRK